MGFFNRLFGAKNDTNKKPPVYESELLVNELIKSIEGDDQFIDIIEKLNIIRNDDQFKEEIFDIIWDFNYLGAIKQLLMLLESNYYCPPTEYDYSDEVCDRIDTLIRALRGMTDATGDISAAKPLLDFAKNHTHNNFLLSEMALDALDSFEDANIAKELIDLLNDEIFCSPTNPNDDNSKIAADYRIALIAQALGKTNDISAIESLISLATTSQNAFTKTRIAYATEALGSFSDHQVIDILNINIKSSYKLIRECANTALLSLDQEPEMIIEIQDADFDNKDYEEFIKTNSTSFDSLTKCLLDSNRSDLHVVYKFLEDNSKTKAYIDYLGRYHIENSSKWTSKLIYEIRIKIEKEYFGRLINEGNSDIKTLLRFGFANAYRRNIKTAKNIFTSCLQSNNNSAEALLGLALLSLREYETNEEVIGFLLDAHSIKPSMINVFEWPGNDLYYNIGKHYIISKQKEIALAYLIKGEKLNPNSPIINGLLGEAYIECGYISEGIDAFLRQIENSIDDSIPHIYLEVIYQALGDYDNSYYHQEQNQKKYNLGFTYERRCEIAEYATNPIKKTIPSID